MLALRLFLLAAILLICNTTLSRTISFHQDNGSDMLQIQKYLHIQRPQLYRSPKIATIFSTSEEEQLLRIAAKYRVVDKLTLKTLPIIIRRDDTNDSFEFFHKGAEIPVSHNISGSSPHQQFEILRPANVVSNDLPTDWAVMQVVGFASLLVVNNVIASATITGVREEVRSGYFLREVATEAPFMITEMKHSLMGKIVIDGGQKSILSAGKIVRVQFDKSNQDTPAKGGLLGIYKNLSDAQNRCFQVGKLTLLTNIDQLGYALAAVLRLKPVSTHGYSVASVTNYE